jgi:capsular polysaccharide biosynthesis protein
MELNEALRRIVIGHWKLIAVLVVLPVLVVAGLHLTTVPTYSAAARVQASSSPPGSDTEADAVLSRVDGIATSSTVIEAALAKTKITGRTADQISPEVGVNRLGSSAVFDISVTDREPKVAVALSGAIAQQVVAFLNGSGSQQPNSLLDQLDQQQSTLRTQRTQLATNLALAKDPVQVANLSAQLASVDQELSNVASSIQGVQSQTLSASSAAMISTPTDAAAVPSTISTDLGLAGLAGLIVALLIASILEVLRPRVADARAVAREMGAPMLGRLTSHKEAERAHAIARPEVRVALARAAERHTVTMVVLTGLPRNGRLTALAADLRAGLAGRIGPVIETPAATEPSSTANGQLPALSGDLEARTVTLTPVREAPTDLRVREPLAEPVTVHVLAMSEVDDGTRGQRVGLVAVVPDLAPYAEVRRLNDLLATTGWPLIGVLGDPVRTGRRSR